MSLSALEAKISYTFKNRAYIETACRHSSFVNEHPDKTLENNERLEFLGDAVLNLVIGHLLMDTYPDLPEGLLSRMRANIVNETQLSDIARRIDLGRFLSLGKGEMQSKGYKKNSILADALEALIAAVYKDGGFHAAFTFIENRFASLVAAADVRVEFFDYKSKLQEIVQMSGQEVPVYAIISEEGPDHDKTFHAEITIQDMKTTGCGKSKKAAEQNAAHEFIKQFMPDVLN